MIINEDNYKHSNMNLGGLEGQCSGSNIARIASSKLGNKLTAKEVFEGAKEDNSVLSGIIRDWVINVLSLIHI